MSSAALLRGLVLAVGVAFVGCASVRPKAAVHRPAPPPVPIREELDVVYGKGGSQDLKLDVFVPTELPGPMPALVVLHGGGWSGGSKDSIRPTVRSFATQGYVTVAVGYRLVPQYRFPAPLEDAKCAVRWLRANAGRYNVDPERIGALGSSAGAHLALMLGLTEPKDGFEGSGGYAEQSSSVQAIVNMMGPTDLTRTSWPAVTDKMIAELVGFRRDQGLDAYRASSPLTYVHRGAPPVLTVHGTKDRLVPYEQAKLLHAALRKAGVPSSLESGRGGGHGDHWSADDSQHSADIIREFLAKYLKRH
jgi:acetyl esterase/lipase